MSNGFTFHEPPEVRYRHYRYNGSRTTPNGLEILSVTQALGVLDKSGPLQGYAAKITLEGVAAVLEKGARDVSKPRRAVSADELAALLRRGRLTFRDRTGDAQNRGKAVHKALEDWINEGAIPQPDKYPAGWRGYIRALAGWLAAERPTFEESEVVVGSV